MRAFPSILLALLVALAAGCARAPAEQRLRDTIAAMETAIEANQVNDFLDGVSSEFTGNGGQYDRRSLHALLRAMALRHQRVSVVLGPLDITIHEGGRASVRVDVLATGSAGGLLPEAGRRFRIDSGWREEDGEWRCISATWNE